MESIKKVVIISSWVLLGIVFCVIAQLSAMSMSSLQKSGQKVRVYRQQEHYKSNSIWVKCSDGIIVQVPEWQIDQMKVLQVFLVHQRGNNSHGNPINAAMVTSKQLDLMQVAFNCAYNQDVFENFCHNLSKDEKDSLINTSFLLEAQGLVSLVINVIFSLEVQERLGATIAVDGIMRPVVTYLQSINTILSGHKGVVRRILFSQDGRYMVTAAAGFDNNLLLWDSLTGTIIKSLVDQPSVINAIALSKDGSCIVAGLGRFFDNCCIWNGKTGQEMNILLKGDRGCMVTSVACSADGNFVVAGLSKNQNNVVMWNTKSGEEKIFEGHETPIKAIAMSDDGNYIVSGSVGNRLNNLLIVWDVKNNTKKNLEGHGSSVTCVAVSKDGKYVVSGSIDGKVIVWDIKTGEKIRVFDGRSPIRCIALSNDGEYLVSGSIGVKDNVIVWNIKNGSKRICKGHDNGVTNVALSADGQIMLSYSEQSTNKIIVWGTGQQLQRITPPKDQRILCAALSAEGTFFGYGYGNDIIIVSLQKVRVFKFISAQMNLAQARLLYRLYLAKINNIPVILDKSDLDYQLYLSLPQEVQQVVQEMLPFELASDKGEKAIQKRTDELRASLFYYRSYIFGIHTEKTLNEKIKAVEEAMKKFNKNSVDYKACERLRGELEQERTFKELDK